MSSLWFFKLKNSVFGDSNSAENYSHTSITDCPTTTSSNNNNDINNSQREGPSPTLLTSAPENSNSHFKSMSSLEYEIIQTFFKEVTCILNSYPFHEKKCDFFVPLIKQQNYQYDKNIKENHNQGNEESYLIPISLQQQRQRLLSVQLQVLEKVLEDIQKKFLTVADNGCSANHNIGSVSLHDIQQLLKSMGEDDDRIMSLISSNHTQKQALLRKNMNDMNQAARMAFARSVLYCEMTWIYTQEHYDETSFSITSLSSSWPIDYSRSQRTLRRSVQDGEMDRDSMMEYCGLCVALMNMVQVKAYIETGQRIQLEEDFRNHSRIEEEEEYDDENHMESSLNHIRKTHVSAQHRILLLQQLMLCAIGFEPHYGGEQIRKFLQVYHDRMCGSDEEEDTELKQQISTYLFSIQTAAQMALESSTPSAELSDEVDGGVTRVVSVKYSETNLTEMAPPSHSKMEEQEERESHTTQDFKLIAKAASLQSNILDELDAMEEDRRLEELRKGKDMHEKIMSIVLSLETGLERVQYLQDISPDEQRLLLIYKLWENRKDS